MPVSKQARSAQARQKDRLAALQVQKSRQRRRNQIIAGVVIAVVSVGFIFGAIAIANSNNSSSSNTSSPPTAAPTTAPVALASVKGKPCGAMKGKPAAGQPSVPVITGPPPTKLVTKDLKTGTGAVVTKDMTAVSVDYIGVSCSNGEVFDSGNLPVNLKQGGLIQGFLQGVPGMKVGGTRLLAIPPDLGYKSQGYPPKIAPDESLFFVVTVKSAK